MPPDPKGIVWDAPHPDEIKWDDGKDAGQPNPIIDAARSIPGGLAKGIAGTVGAPSSALNFIANQAGRLVGRDQIPDADPRATTFLGIPTTGQLNASISAPTGGYYEPKTVPGQYAQTIAEFAPNAMLPGGIAARAARVVVPAAASEASGQATKGTPYEPFARAGGALLGGLAEGAGEGFLASKADAVPTAADLKSQANSLYQGVRDAKISVSKDAYGDLVKDINSAVKEAGTHPKLHPKVAGALESLDEVKGADVPLGDLERLRRVVKGAASSIEPDERRVAGVALGKIDNFIDNLSPEQVSSGDASAAAKLSDARDLWARLRKSEVIDDAMERAQNSARAQTGNLAAGLRDQFKSLSNNAKVMRQFSPAEQDAIKQVARVGPITGPMAALGAMRPRGIMGAAELVGALANPESAALPLAATGGAGFLAQKGLNAMTAANAARVAAMIRMGQGAALPAAQTGPTSAAMLADLLLSQQGR